MVAPICKSSVPKKYRRRLPKKLHMKALSKPADKCSYERVLEAALKFRCWL